MPPRSTRSRNWRPVGLALALAAALCATADSRRAQAFPHVVRQGETLAKIAEKVYGAAEHERILVAANGLDAGGGISIGRGMRLEIPAVSHQRVQPGETWATLAEALLGDAERADVLSAANDSSPWLAPSEGAEIAVPYNLRVVAGPGDSIVSIAARFLGSKEKGWVLDRYNRLKGVAVKRGDVVLVPLTTIKLTDEGRAEALVAGALDRSQAGGGVREVQRRVDAEMPSLLAEVRSGRYVDAVTRGTRMLTYGDLARPQVALVQRQLLEAYVALEARGHASSACRAWREADPQAALDPIQLSPKILTVCDASLSAPNNNTSSNTSFGPISPAPEASQRGASPRGRK